MTIHLDQAWTSVVDSPLFGITLTLAAYWAARALWRHTKGHALANPVLVATLIVLATLLTTRTSYDSYRSGAQYITVLLGPATVALAVPLYRQATRIRQAAPTVIACTLVGSITSILVAITVTKLLGGDNVLALTMAPKSATTPVSIAVSASTGGIPELTAALTIITGVLGAIAAPAILTAMRVKDHRIRGLAIGMSTHGIGTSRALADNPTEGAFSGLAMALNAPTTAILVPTLLLITPWITSS
jgi:predicted murein hydrolase (TIGR00659 family)